MNQHNFSQFDDQAQMDVIKAEIASTFAKIDALKAEMAAWYAEGRTQRFPRHPTLAALEVSLSQLDTAYKTLWDAKQNM